MTQNTTEDDSPLSVNLSLLGVAARDLKRLQVVFKIIARHGFGELFLRSAIGKIFFNDVKTEGAGKEQLPAAMRFRKLLEDLGPTYIKFGQIMSMRPDILPASYITALEGLQDQTPSVPFEDIQAVVERGLGKTLAEAFREFEREPLARASIAQTHRAVTHDGVTVVVKVQRPGIEQTMRGDLSLLFMLAKALELGIEEMRLIAPAEFVVEFERALLSELDFTEELANLEKARSLLDPTQQVVAPKPFMELSCKTVMTMEYFAGRSLRHVTPNSAEAKHAVEQLLNSLLKQVFIDGFFHGDPHSGNILINDKGEVCLIDFGLVGTLRDDQRADLVTLVIALMAKDAATITRVFLRMGTPLKRVNLVELRGDVTRILNEYVNVDSFRDLKSRELADEFVDAAQRYQIKLASEYSLLMKAGLTIEGLVRSLYPNVDAMAIAKPFIKQLMADRFSPKGLLNDSMSQIMGLPDLLKQLPGQLDQILHDSQSGNLQIRSLTPQLDLLPQTVHHLGSRLALAAFATSMTLAAIVFLAIPERQSFHIWLIVLSILSAVSSWWILLVWHFVQSGRPYRANALLQFFRR